MNEISNSVFQKESNDEFPVIQDSWIWWSHLETIVILKPIFCCHFKVDLDTLYRENDSFRDRDLIRITQCRLALNFSDAELLHNILVSI